VNSVEDLQGDGEYEFAYDSCLWNSRNAEPGFKKRFLSDGVEECVVANGNASEWGRAIGKWPLGKVDRFRVEKLRAFCEKHITTTTLANSFNNRIARDQNDIKIKTNHQPNKETEK
jgi:hypothetical protein